MGFISRTAPLTFSNGTHKTYHLPEFGATTNVSVRYRMHWSAGSPLFGFLFSVSSRELCRVQKDSLSSSYLHKSSARRVSTRSPVRDIQSYEAHNGKVCTFIKVKYARRDDPCSGETPDFLTIIKPTTGSSGVREKATLKKISTLVNLVEPLINLADFIPFQVFSIPAGTGAEITG